MATISVTLPNDGDTIEAADYNTPINTILDEFNGNIDNENIKSGANIDGTKLADASTPTSKIIGGIMISDRQNITSDATITSQRIYSGWTYIQGDGDSNAKKTITLPASFDDTNYRVFVTVGGSKATAPTSSTDATGTGSDINVVARVTAANTFDIEMKQVAGSNWSDYKIVHWIAIGTKA